MSTFTVAAQLTETDVGVTEPMWVAEVPAGCVGGGLYAVGTDRDDACRSLAEVVWLGIVFGEIRSVDAAELTAVRIVAVMPASFPVGQLESVSAHDR